MVLGIPILKHTEVDYWLKFKQMIKNLFIIWQIPWNIIILNIKMYKHCP